MNTFGWHLRSTHTVAAGATAVVDFPTSHPLLEKLTVWAVSREVLADVLITVTANGNPIGAGASVNITGATAGHEVLSGSDRVFPGRSPQKDELHAPLGVQVTILNSGPAPATLTIIAAAIAREGA